MKAFVVAIACLFVASPALAQMSGGSTTPGSGIGSGESAEVPEGPATAENSDSDHRICRRVESDSSSRMGTHRVCLTAEQWRQQQQRRN